MARLLGTVSSSVQKSFGAFESIATVTGTGSSNTITFSSIPGTYQHLQIRARMKSDGTSTDPTNVNMTFNGSTATNYASHRMLGYGTGISADGLATQANIRLTRLSLNSDASQANMVGVAIIDIHDYTSTTKAKTVRSFYGNDINAANSLIGPTIHSGLWTLTNAITSITFTLAAGNFTNQTQFALYGIKGA